LAPLAMPAVRLRAAEVKGVETSPGLVILGRHVAWTTSALANYSIGTEPHTRYHLGPVLWKMK